MIHIDVPMPLSYANKAFLKEMEQLEPFGVGNPRPLFARKELSILSGSKLGKSGRFRKFQIAEGQESPYPVVYFGDGEELDAYLINRYGKELFERIYHGRLERGMVRISMVYYPDWNFYQGRESVQLIMQDYC